MPWLISCPAMSDQKVSARPTRPKAAAMTTRPSIFCRKKIAPFTMLSTVIMQNTTASRPVVI